MNSSRLFSVTLVPLLVACVSTNVDVPRDHPANPSAPVTQVALTPALTTTVSATEEAAPAAHQHGGHEQHGGRDQHGSTPAASASPATPAPASAAAPAAPSTQADKPAAEVWTCPMHAEVVKSGPGQCPICGMNLVKRASGKGK
jgi:hypothetical protein